MKRWALRPETFLFAAALFMAAPLAAQEATVPTPAAGAVTPPAPATAPLPGPRVTEPQRRVEPSFAGSHESNAMRRSNQTITVSTLVLVLAVVILVLLIA